MNLTHSHCRQRWVHHRPHPRTTLNDPSEAHGRWVLPLPSPKAQAQDLSSAQFLGGAQLAEGGQHQTPCKASRLLLEKTERESQRLAVRRLRRVRSVEQVEYLHFTVCPHHPICLPLAVAGVPDHPVSVTIPDSSTCQINWVFPPEVRKPIPSGMGRPCIDQELTLQLGSFYN